MELNLTAPCHFGLEKTLSFEIKRAGGENVSSSDGRVNFTGDLKTLIRANIGCSVAERIGLVIAEFDAESFDDVFENIKRCQIGEYIGKNDKFPVVKGQSVNSKLSSIPALQRTVKKALALNLSEYHKTKELPETGINFPVRFFLFKDRMTVFLDSSGAGLHKRGYREISNAAPIRETLAAGLVDLAKVKDIDTVIDPFCGSGTILIEAAYKALNIAPCLKRAERGIADWEKEKAAGFSAMDWGFIPKELWREAISDFKAAEKRDNGFHAYGYDIDYDAVRLSQSNASKAGLDKYITAERRAVKDFNYPVQKCKIITNPPYAERMLETAEAEKIYREMGQIMLPRGENELYVITAYEGFEKLFGERAARNRKLYNGMLLCRYYQYI